MTAKKNIDIGRLLLEEGLISSDTLTRALELQTEAPDKKIGEILVEIGVPEEFVLQGLSKKLGLAYVDRTSFPETLPVELSFEFMKNCLILPLRFENGRLQVAMADPEDKEVIDNLKASLGCAVEPFIASKNSIIEHLERLSKIKESTVSEIMVNMEEIAEEIPEELNHLKGMAQEKGVIRLVDLLIEKAVNERASDIHIEPEETRLRVRYRIDGILYDREFLPRKMQPAITSRIKLLSQMNIAERRLPQDGRIKGTYGGRPIDIRVSTIPTVYGESIVMRLLDKETAFLTLEELGMDPETLKKYESLIQRPYGMILITGPTGSGKTTTLYASLDRINSPDKKIITIEEPVEYLMKGINQIQVKPKIGLTFASGLRHIVRQDPDVIMVGEIRDLETAGIAIHAALTGHLIFSTLHTNDAPGAMTRLMDMGVENYLVSSTLIGVVAQRLVRRICTSCRVEYRVPEELKKELRINQDILWRGTGCEKCSNTGYRGRIGIFELLVVNDEIRNMIMAKATSREMREKAISLGMKTLRQDGIEKVTKGITTAEEVLRVTQQDIE
ncbi:MAG: type II secretion system ATPase GspE [Thermodesulfovibrionales bacterium]|nr:type II secretion system ATPase GspE [Thermodesulfovibrionales bacterium]